MVGMRGLELSRNYYNAYGQALLASVPPSVGTNLAMGLVGAGSECLGFDDELSRDHDFGPGFCVWAPRAVYVQWGPELVDAYERLPRSFGGLERNETSLAGQRVGVFETEAFYRTFTGLERAPQSVGEWLSIPEQLLALVADGEVFSDPSRYFTNLREAYRGFYPEQVVRKKLAADLASMAQSGQYNLGRCLRRDDPVAANVARTEFVQSVLAALHLLSRTYMPYYKWSFRSLSERAHVPEPICALVRKVASAPVCEVTADQVDSLCEVVLRCVLTLGWASTTSDFLLDAAVEIWQGLDSDYLRGRPLEEGVFH